MLQLLIARHGNTFDNGETVLRVGCGTDLPLSLSGQQQAKNLGQYLLQHHPNITAVFTSHLKRTIETAEIALQQMNTNLTIQQSALFDEVDYGPDEGKPESEVIARIGTKALQQWEQDNIVPDGWHIEPQAISSGWLEFGKQLQQQYVEGLILIVTSNGIARFAPGHAVKLKTGAVSLLCFDGDAWRAEYTNYRPLPR